MIIQFEVAVYKWLVDPFGMNRLQPAMFVTRGVMPAGYAALALVLGVTVGMLIRSTVAAMAGCSGPRPASSWPWRWSCGHARERAGLASSPKARHRGDRDHDHDHGLVSAGIAYETRHQS